MEIQHCKSGPERKARATSWWIVWIELLSCPKLFKRDFKFNPSYVLSQYRRVNFTLRECRLAHIVVLLWKVHFRLNLQYSPSLFLSPLPILRPTKGNLVSISQHKICFHLWHTQNNPSMQRLLPAVPHFSPRGLIPRGLLCLLPRSATPLLIQLISDFIQENEKMHRIRILDLNGVLSSQNYKAHFPKVDGFLLHISV